MINHISYEVEITSIDFFGNGDIRGDLLCKDQKYMEAMQGYDAAINNPLTSSLLRATACVNKLRLKQKLFEANLLTSIDDLTRILHLYEAYEKHFKQESFAEIVFLLDKAHLAKKMNKDELWQSTYDTVLALIDKKCQQS
jgi:Tfp pilus assembly protein PilF